MTTLERPYALVAELTYQCPLRCAYCSNPLEFKDHPDRLDARAWIRVMREAEEPGVLQVLLSGGDPLLRRDLTSIIGGAAEIGLYSSLTTSGMPLERERLVELGAAGLDAMHFENVRSRSLEYIWHESTSFQAFRGEAWMPMPCATCERRTLDFGGCRCQAFHLTGDASATDPACSLSPAHGIV